MPYQYNKPLATDQLSVSQGDINGNFQALGAIGGNGTGGNSFGLNVAPGTGFNFLYLNVGASPPLGTAFATHNALYIHQL